MAFGALVVLLLPFSAAFALSTIVDRMLKHNMSSVVRGIFVITVGYLTIQGLPFISLSSCGMFGAECP